MNGSWASRNSARVCSTVAADVSRTMRRRIRDASNSSSKRASTCSTSWSRTIWWVWGASFMRRRITSGPAFSSTSTVPGALASISLSKRRAISVRWPSGLRLGAPESGPPYP